MRALALLLALIALVPATVLAAPSTDDNAGRWADTFTDDDGVLAQVNTAWDPAGRRVVLTAVGTPGTFLSGVIQPASFSAWGGLYVDYSAASDASVSLWVYDGVTVYGKDGATGTLLVPPLPLVLGPSDRSGYSARAAIPAAVPVANATSLQVFVRMTGATLPPAINALEVSWTPKSIVTARVEGPASVQSAETIGIRVNVAVSFVDAKDLVVEADLPVARPNAASALQDQTVAFVSATGGGALSGDGKKVVWNLGTRKAGETFTLVYTTRTQMGLLDQILYDVQAKARLSNGTDAVATLNPPTKIISTPGPVIERVYGAGAYRINNLDYVFPDTDLEIIVQGWNYKYYPSVGGETLFDAFIWDDVTQFVSPSGAGAPTDGPTDISHGGLFTAVEIPLANGKKIPANSVYWKKDPTHWASGFLTVGQSFQYRYKVHVRRLTTDPVPGPVTKGQTLTDCATLESAFASQLTDKAGPACRTVRVDEPFEPNGVFAKGEEIRGFKGVSAGQDLVSPTQVKAAFGETMSYFLLTYNTGVSQLDDIVMLDRIPTGMVFEGAFLPPEAAGSVWYYDGAAGDAYSAPELAADGSLGGGWSQTLPEDRTTVTWVAFRVPKLFSSYFPDTNTGDGVTPFAAEGEIVVTILPPVGVCPATDTEIQNVGLFNVYKYTKPGKPTEPILDGGLHHANMESTIVVPDLPSLLASTLSDSPSTAVATQPLVYTLNLNNVSPPGTYIPLDDALGVSAVITIPKVAANGVLTALLIDSVSAPGGTIAYNLPNTITVTYAAAIAPNTSRTISLATRVPSGVIDGTSFSISARLDWHDDLCGSATTSLTEPTSFFGLPALQVSKTADFGYGQTGTTLVYTLDYVNSAQSPSTKSWLVDRIPPGSLLDRAKIPTPAGEVWFSTALPAAVPAALSPTDPFTDARVRANFVRASDGDGDGWVTPPANATYVAFLVDDATLTPPQLITGVRRSATFEATITNGQLGAIIGNQAAILSKELIQAISNKVNFTVTPRPGLRISKSCPGVVATNEELTYTIDYYNDSSNTDDRLTLVETLPAGLAVVAVSHEWNDAYGGNANPTITRDGQTITVEVPELAPLEGGRLFVTVVAQNGITSGTFLLPETLGTAYGEDGNTRSGYAACSILIENADLYVRKLVDNPAPRAGEAFQYTIVVSNQGAHDSLEVAIRDVLPTNLQFIPGSVVVTPSPWTAGPPSDPTVIGSDLVWSKSTGNGLGRDGDLAALLPGRSGNVSLIFGARVKPTVLPGTTIRNCAFVSTATGEDAAFANQGCAEITTPLPDPWITKIAPALKKPGEKVTWTISYGNSSNEVAGGVVIIDRLPDNPILVGDGFVDVTFASALAPHGEAIWYYQCPIATGCASVPTFTPTSHAGWTQTATPSAGNAVSYVAFYVGDLAPLAPTRTVQVSAILTTPGGVLAPAGAAYNPCATIAMTTSGYLDQDPNNNVGCAPTRVPGVDIQASKTSDPGGLFPGVEPGDTVTFYLGVVNSGTVPAFGITLTDALPSEVELVTPPQATIELTDSAGGTVNPINLGGQRIAGPVTWTRVGNTFYMGLNDTSALGYKSVGMLPGDRATLVLVTRVKDGVANQSIVRNSVAVATTSVEEIKGNNSATTEVGVYRADPFIIKTVKSSDGVVAGTVDVGDEVVWRLEYGNAGDYTAENVIIEDPIPEGLDFIVGSVGGVNPETMSIVYSDDGGVSWGYQPSGLSGSVDAAVTHVRVVWKDGLPAPASGLFVQTSAGDFEEGTHANTRPDGGLDAVVPTGDNKCDLVTCEPVDEKVCVTGTFIPPDGCCEECRPSVGACEETAPVEVGCLEGSGCYPRGSCEGTCKPPQELFHTGFTIGANEGIYAFRFDGANIDRQPDLVLPLAPDAYALTYDVGLDMLVVAHRAAGAVYIYDGASSIVDGALPSRTLSGIETMLLEPEDVAVDAQRNLLYVSCLDGRIVVFDDAGSVDGAAVPRTVNALHEASWVFPRIDLDSEHDVLYVTDYATGMVYRYDNASALQDDTLPDAELLVSDIPSMWGISFDAKRDILYVGSEQGGVFVYDQTSTKPSGYMAPDRVISGNQIGFQGVAGLFIDSATDTLYASDPQDNKLLIFANASVANGEVAPTWQIDSAADYLIYPADFAVIGRTRDGSLEDTNWTLTLQSCQRFQDENATAWVNCAAEVQATSMGTPDIPAACDRFRCENLDENGVCIGEPTAAWTRCWPSECPDYQAYDCEAQRYWDDCNVAYKASLKSYLACNTARLKFMSPSFDCGWLAPEDTCGRCDSATCANTPESLSTWGQVRWSRDLEILPTITELYWTFKEAGETLPSSVVLVDNVSACAPEPACVDASANDCAIPCNCQAGQDCLCQNCWNGAACYECLPQIIREREASMELIEYQPVSSSVGCSAVARNTQETYYFCLNRTGYDTTFCKIYEPVACELSQECAGGIYTSPEFPTDDEGNVISWKTAIFGESGADPERGKQITYSVIDADSGAPVEGFSELDYPDNGTLDISAIDAQAHPRLQLAARFKGASTGDFTMHRGGFPFTEACETWRPEVYFQPIAISDNGLVTGIAEDCYQDKPFIWRKDWLDPVLLETGTTDVYPFDINNRDEIVGHGDTVPEEGRIPATFSFYWSEDTGVIDIAATIDYMWNDHPIVNLSIEDINNDGIAAGWLTVMVDVDANTTEPQLYPVTWSYLGGMTVLERDGGFSEPGCALTPYDWESSTRITDNGWFGGIVPVGDNSCSNATALLRWNTTDGTWAMTSKEEAAPTQFFGIDSNGRMGFDWGYFWDGETVTNVYDEAPPADELITDPYFYRMEEDGTALGGCDVERELATDPRVLLSDIIIIIGDGPSTVSTACVLGANGKLTALPVGRNFQNNGWDSAEALASNSRGDVLVLHYHQNLSRFGSVGDTALWDGSAYQYVDGYDPSLVSQTWSSWYVWDSYSGSPLNNNRELTGHAIGDSNLKEFGVDRPYIWSPATEPLALLDWRVIYATDRNPSVTLATSVAGLCADELTNNGTIATSSPEVSTANNESSASVQMNRADLRVVVRPFPAVVGPATDFYTPDVSWQVSIYNDGPGVARGIDMALDLPGYGTDTISVDDLPAGESWSESYAGYSTETAANASIVGNASVLTASLDCNQANNAGSGTVFVGSWPNVFVSVDGPPSAVAGETFVYAFEWGNNGNDDSNNTVITIDVPPGLIAASWPDNCTPSGDQLVCNYGTVSAGGGGTEYVSFATAGCDAVSANGYFVSATIVTTSIEVDTSDNQGADATRILAPPGEMSLAIAQSHGVVAVGQSLTWTIYFENTGLGGIIDPGFNVPIPAGMEYVADSASGGAQLVGNNPAVLVFEGDTLAPGDAGAVQFALRVTAATVGAVVATSEGEGACPNSISGSVTVAPAGLNLVKGVDRDRLCGQPRKTDSTLDWSITVTNTGASMRTNVVVSDLVPAGLAYVAGTIYGVGADASDAAKPSWDIGNLAPGAALTVGYKTELVAPLAGIVVGGAASASSTQGDTVSGDTFVQLDCDDGVVFTKAWTAACGLPGDSRGLVLTVVNHGSTPLANVRVNDVLPASLVFLSSSDGAKDPTTGVFGADLGTLRPGDARQLTISFRIAPSAASGTVYTNAATLLAAALPPQVSNQVVGAVLSCEDANVCTDNGCSATLGCVFTSADNGTSCNDDNACTRTDVCAGGTCSGTNPVVCTSLGQCNGVGTCEPTSGLCSNPLLPAGTACNDGSACTAQESCSGGECGPGTAVNCDDGNPCTVDSCNPESGCVHVATSNGLTCDDGDACSTTSECRVGECVATYYLSCSDSNPCTVDACDPQTGCDFDKDVVDLTPCDDLDVCTNGTTCEAGVCGQGTPISCADDNACTSESCDATLGCIVANVPDGATCDDGLVCTSASSCSAGQCQGTAFVACDDGNACTTERCDAQQGCVSEDVAAGASCDDGALCTTDDACDGAGGCAGEAVVCGEPSECELPGTCNADTGACDFPVKPGDTAIPLRLTDLGSEGETSEATALSGSTVVGWSEDENGVHQVASWDASGPSEHGAGEATGVNNNGQIAAVRGADVVFIADGSSQVLWTRGTVDGDAAPVFGPTATGVVAGQSGTGPALRLANGSVVRLAAPDANHVDVMRAHGGGWAVGTEEGIAGAIDARGFRWNGSGARELLALPAGASASSANAVGASGHIGGDVTTAAGQAAALWLPDGTAVVLPPACVAGGACLTATTVVAVDGAGRFLGNGQLADGSERAFIGELGGEVSILEPTGAVASHAVALSDELAIGTWETAAGALLGFVFSESDGLVELGGGAKVEPTQVAGAWVLGVTTSVNANRRAFLWSAARGLEDLGSLGGGSSDGLAVDTAGRVVGWSATQSGERHAFATNAPVFGCVACGDDRDPPSIQCPVIAKPIECSDGVGMVAIGKPSARDLCTFPVEVSGDVPESFPLGATDVVFTARDALGNEASCSLTVKVVDTLPPTVTCPTPRTVQQPAGTCGVTVALAATTDDGCDAEGVTVLSNAPASFAVGTTTVSFTAIDAAGNSAECTTTVTVEDPSPLAIACDPDLTVEAPADFCGWPEAISAVVTDECAADITVESAADSFPVGLSTVTFEARNEAGEQASCVTQLTVVDVIDPEVLCNTMPVLGEGDLPHAFGATASDICSAVVVVSDLACVRVGDSEEVFSEGCDARVETDTTVIVGKVDPGADYKGSAVVRWSVSATDPSGNTASVDCETVVQRDRDGDGVLDVDDNCVLDANSDQRDLDEDGLGNACDDHVEGLTAEGDGGCSGSGGAGALGLLVGALALVMRRRRA